MKKVLEQVFMSHHVSLLCSVQRWEEMDIGLSTKSFSIGDEGLSHVRGEVATGRHLAESADDIDDIRKL